MIKHTRFVYVLAITASLSLAPIVNSAELRPLNLPSSQRQYTAPTKSYARPVAQPTVYDRFRTTVQGLNQTEKDEYRRAYSTSLDDARAKGDQTAVTYYQELLSILN
jgi:hypothetical protein